VTLAGASSALVWAIWLVILLLELATPPEFVLGILYVVPLLLGASMRTTAQAWRFLLICCTSTLGDSNRKIAEQLGSGKARCAAPCARVAAKAGPERGFRALVCSAMRPARTAGSTRKGLRKSSQPMPDIHRWLPPNLPHPD
jgi:hypothetical protein